jgi:hypothetical protein
MPNNGLLAIVVQPLLSSSKTLLSTAILSATLTITGCGGGGSSSDAAEVFDIVSSQLSAINGAAVDGPVANALVAVYTLDTSAINLKGPRLTVGDTDDVGKLINLMLDEEQLVQGPYLIEVTGGTDLTTGMPPILSTMQTLVDANKLTLNPQAVYATPLTTLAIKTAQQLMINDTELKWFDALNAAQSIVRNIYGLGLLGNTNSVDDENAVDLFTTAPIATEDGDLDKSLDYRLALETFTAIADQIQRSPTVTSSGDDTDDVLAKLAADISDGDIDGQNGNDNIAVFEDLTDLVQLATEVPANIAGTSIPLADLTAIFVSEASQAYGIDIAVIADPEPSPILSGVDFNGNGVVDSNEDCDASLLALSGYGQLIGRDSNLVNSTYTYSGPATVETTQQGERLVFEQLQGLVNALGQSEIITQGYFDLVTGAGVTTITSCEGSDLVCADIIAVIGTPAADSDIQVSDLDASNPLSISWSQIDVVDTGQFGLADSASFITASVACGDEEPDADQDGVSDSEDAFPADPAASVDSDSDGSPDQWNSGQNETDSTLNLVLDAFPNDPAASVDTDGDGFPDKWNSGNDETDSTSGLSLDELPNNSTESKDSDFDGTGDNADGFAQDASASVDTDIDGSPDEWNFGKDAFDSTSLPALILDACIGSGKGYLDSDGDDVCEDIQATPLDACIGTDLGNIDTDSDGVCEDVNTAEPDQCIGASLGYSNTDGDVRCDEIDIPLPDVRPADPLIWSICQVDAADRSPGEDLLVVTSCINSDGDIHVDDLDNCPNDDSDTNINTDRFLTTDVDKGWVDGDEICDENEAANGDDDSDADGIPDGSDTGSFHPELANFNSLARDEYIFEYTMAAIGTGVGLTIDDGDTTDLDSDPDPFPILDTSSTVRLQLDDEPAVTGVGLEVPAIYNLYTRTLVWSEIAINGPIALFNLWADNSIDTTDTNSLTGVTTVTNCQQVGGIAACGSAGFVQAESDDPVQWLTPSLVAAAGTIPQAGANILSDFSDLNNLTFTTEVTATDVFGPGTPQYIEITTIYTFTCNSENCP